MPSSGPEAASPLRVPPGRLDGVWMQRGPRPPAQQCQPAPYVPDVTALVRDPDCRQGRVTALGIGAGALSLHCYRVASESV